MSPGSGKEKNRSSPKQEAAERKRLTTLGYVECPSCNKMIKPGLSKCPKCGKMMPRARKRLIVAAVLVTAIVVVAGVILALPGSEGPQVPPYVVDFSPMSTSAIVSSPIMITFSRYMDQDSVRSAFSISPAVSGTFSFQGLKMVFAPSASLASGTTYEVRVGSAAKDLDGRGLDSGTFGWFFTTEGMSDDKRTLGSGADNFWIAYPKGHTLAGVNVNHPSWVTDALSQGPVLILDHSTNCQPCIVQTGICERVAPSYAGQVTYMDLISGANEPMASQAFSTYDPNGGVNYIPLTIIVTKARDASDNVVIVWHSWEGVVYEEMLRSWLNDAVAHHQMT